MGYSYQQISREDILREIREALPKPEDRMTAARKEAILTGIRHGIIEAEDAMRLYCLSEAELTSWATNFSLRGREGLEATKLPKRRERQIFKTAPMRVAA